MERWIDGADGDRLTVHRLEHAIEVVTLQRQQLVQRRPPLGFGIGENHPLDDRNAPFAEEHVLGPAQPDAAGAEPVRELGLVGKVGIRVHTEPAMLVGPRQQRVESAVNVGLLRAQRAVHDLQDLARLGRHARQLHFAGQPVE